MRDAPRRILARHAARDAARELRLRIDVDDHDAVVAILAAGFDAAASPRRSRSVLARLSPRDHPRLLGHDQRMDERVSALRRFGARERDVGQLAAVDRRRPDRRMLARRTCGRAPRVPPRRAVELRDDLVGVDRRCSRAPRSMRAIVDLPLAIPPVRPARRIIARRHSAAVTVLLHQHGDRHRSDAARDGRDPARDLAHAREVDVADEHRAVLREQPRFVGVVRECVGVRTRRRDSCRRR